MKDVKVCVLRMEGTNCEDEMAQAFEMVGGKAEKVHLKQLSGNCPIGMERCLEDYDILAFPGGFSAGDYIRAGAIFAARLKSTVGKDLKKFVEDGKPVLGVCNGFQILVELGLLPALSGVMTEQPEAALYNNDSGRFECRPSLLKNVNRGKCIFTRGISSNKLLEIPSAHAEGRLMSMNPDFVEKLRDNDQIVFEYASPDGESKYPWNPNGSPGNIAGICNPDGNVFGMMPHPERVMTRFTHSSWTRGYVSEIGDGYALFDAVMKYLR